MVMSKIDELLEAYRAQVSLQWDEMLSGQEKVWFCVYDPSYERRIRARLGEFKIVTVQSGTPGSRSISPGCLRSGYQRTIL